jgi:hypothetical protein
MVHTTHEDSSGLGRKIIGWMVFGLDLKIGLEFLWELQATCVIVAKFSSRQSKVINSSRPSHA